MGMTANAFVTALQDLAGPAVCDERTLLVDARPSLGPRGRGTCSVYVSLINLPYHRVKQRRGGGAENENNRILVVVKGFNEGEFASIPAETIAVEPLVCNVGHPGQGAQKIRRKTASPEKIAEYLGNYLQGIVTKFPPSFTHE
jgi:hypothetical protein